MAALIGVIYLSMLYFYHNVPLHHSERRPGAAANLAKGRWSPIVHGRLHRSHFQYAHLILSTTLSCRSTPVRMSTRSLISSKNSRPISPGNTCWAVCRRTWTSQRRSPCSLYDSIPCLDGVEAVKIRSMFLHLLACLRRRATLHESLTVALEQCDQASCPSLCHRACRTLHLANGKAQNTPKRPASIPRNWLEVSLCFAGILEFPTLTQTPTLGS